MGFIFQSDLAFCKRHERYRARSYVNKILIKSALKQTHKLIHRVFNPVYNGRMILNHCHPSSQVAVYLGNKMWISISLQILFSLASISDARNMIHDENIVSVFSLCKSVCYCFYLIYSSIVYYFASCVSIYLLLLFSPCDTSFGSTHNSCLIF